jgi:O-succinylbenzoic acid--CoA ligase
VWQATVTLPIVASLQPVSGSPRELYAALSAWAADPASEPLVVRTAGSTGESKEVVLSRAAMLSSARAALARIGGPGQWLLALPADYVAGVQVLLRSALAGTEPVYGGEHDDFEAAAAAMDPGRRRYVSLVPTQLARLARDARALEVLAGFDAVLLGGAGAGAGLLATARRAGVRVVTTYGLTETCGGCVYDGVPLDGVGVRIAADRRIHLLGPVLFDGYRGRCDLTARALADGALRTPDLGRLDDDGRLVVLGRADDVVVSGGVNVALPAVEDRLRQHPALADVALVGVDDPEWGARVVAFAVPAASPEPSLDVLRDFVADALPRAWAPRQLVVVGRVPLLESGKVDRVALRRLL